MRTEDGFPRWDNPMCIDYMKNKLGQPDLWPADNFTHKKNERRSVPTTIKVKVKAKIGLAETSDKVEIEDPPDARRAYSILRNNSPPPSSRQRREHTYKILRSLPGYVVGDCLRKQEKLLCYSKDATLFAKDRLRPGDCAFVRRSDGTFTYALCEGRAEGDQNVILFKLNGDGRFKKRVPASEFCKQVKVPVLLGQVAAPEKDRVATSGRRDLRRSVNTVAICDIDRKKLEDRPRSRCSS